MGIINILMDCLIFSILFIPLNREMPYWVNLGLYIIAFIAKALILYGTITFTGIIIYCIIGALIVWVLQKIVDAFNPLYFVFFAIFMQEIITLIIGFIGILR